MSWSYAAAARGKTGDPGGGDDAFIIDSKGDCLVVAVADGAGSARHSAIGAERVCQYFAACAETYWRKAQLAEAVAGTSLAADVGRDAADVGAAIFHHVLQGVLREAEHMGIEPMELASTLVGAVLLPNEAFFFQLGDGAAVVRQGDGYEVAIEPVETEFVNTTYFITSPGAAEQVRVRTISGSVQEVALFSDGLQGLVMHPMSNEPHATFFETVFRTLRVEGRDEASQTWLANMLASDMVTSRTDDDTSIVIAKRSA